MDDFQQKLADIERRYREAVYTESVVREAAFLGVKLTLCGIKVNQFNPRHYMLLDFMSSPFIKGGIPTAEQVCDFLWVVSPDFKEGDGAAYIKFVEEKCANLDFAESVFAIREYVDHATIDFPPIQKMEGAPRKAEFMAWVAYYVDALASEYGWTVEYIMSLPFALILQQMKAIDARRAIREGKSLHMFNTLSESVRAEGLRLLEEKNKAEKV